MPSIEQLKSYKTTCEKELQTLVDMANKKIEGMDKASETLRKHESPIALTLATYPITLDQDTADVYDLAEIIDLDALEKGVIALKLNLHPQTRDPIIAENLIIYTLKQRQKYIKRLNAFLEKELQDARLNQLLSSFEASLNEAPEAAPAEQPSKAAPLQPNPVVAQDNPQTLSLKNALLMIDHYNGKYDDAFLPKIEGLHSLMGRLLLEQESSSKLKEILSKKPEYPLDDSVKIFTFFLNNIKKYQHAKNNLDPFRTFIDTLSSPAKGLFRSLVFWVNHHNIIRANIDFTFEVEPSVNLNPVVAEKRPQPDPNPNPAPYPAAHPQPLAEEALNAIKPAPDRAIPWAKHDYDGISTYKILVMGDAGSGKSCLLNRHLEGSFDSRRKITMGVDFELKSIDIPDQACSARLQLWVQLRSAYSMVERLYYKEAHGIIITINLNQENALENAEKLLAKIRSYLPASTPTLLVGCKSDLEQKISPEAIRTFTEQHDLPYFETSAMQDTNIDEPFAYLTEQLYLKQHPEAAPMAANPDEQIKTLEDKRRSLSDFNIKHFNELVKKAKLNSESKKKLSESLITALHNKTDELLQTLDARSHHLSKAIDAIRALNSIKNGVELIKMSSVVGFIFSTSQSDQMNAIDNRISLIKEKLDEVAARNNSSLFDLALMKFKLIDCTCLDELKPISDQLLGMLRVAEQGVEGFTKDINPKNGGVKECDARLKAIGNEASTIVFRHLKTLTKKQRETLQTIINAADDCLNVRKKNLSDYHQISLVIEEAKLGIDYAPAPQNRHRH